MSDNSASSSCFTQACPNDAFCLGMCEYTGCITDPTPLDISLPIPPDTPPADTPLSSASSSYLADPPPSKRFKQASNAELSTLSKGFTPKNTDRSTNWALSNFKDWAKEKHINPDDILLSTDPQVLNKNLSRFIVETRKESGQAYPPSTLHQLLCGLLRFMRQKNIDTPNFLEKNDPRFKHLHSTLDSYFNQLHASGVGRQVQHSEIISAQEEDKLWSLGVLNTTTPRGLLNAVFYIIGKSFCLRGGQEHRDLKLSQLKRMDDHYMYYENVSKTCNGSFRKLHLKSKVVPVFAVPEAGERCPVNILDNYISRLPQDAVSNDLFYARPLEKFSNEEKMPWFTAVPLGKNTLQNMVKKMCATAGITGNKTNHSLRATSATEMFKRGVPEKIVQERTGHRSLEALRIYERSSAEQHKAASTILSTKQTTFHQQMVHNKILNIEKPNVTVPAFSFHSLQNCTINITQS